MDEKVKDLGNAVIELCDAVASLDEMLHRRPETCAPSDVQSEPCSSGLAERIEQLAAQIRTAVESLRSLREYASKLRLVIG